MTVKTITKTVTAKPNPSRAHKIAIFGDYILTKAQAKQIAIAIVSQLASYITVYTISTDTLGHQVRLQCRKHGITTYNRKVKPIEGEYSKENMVELAVAGLAWKVETFYCVIDEHRLSGFSKYAVEIGSRMGPILNCKTLAHNKIFK